MRRCCRMAYAVFPGDERYHVVKEEEDYTLCGLLALTPDEGEHHPRARVMGSRRPPRSTASARNVWRRLTPRRVMGWSDGCPAAGVDDKLSALKSPGTHKVRRRHTSRQVKHPCLEPLNQRRASGMAVAHSSGALGLFRVLGSLKRGRERAGRSTGKFGIGGRSAAVSGVGAPRAAGRCLFFDRGSYRKYVPIQ
jgi:hypothetical protein